ncbi:MAG: GNAT family N-acetyltransferase [Ardenticatenaceae bacterium]|nr:GNAT family N-acetyltransferase [Ardenticatenaceae bacterium]
MELANHCGNSQQARGETAVIRTATEEDAPDIYQLLRRATHSHIHVGWHLPIHWLGRDEFLVYEPPARGSSAMNKLWGEDLALRACLVVTANPAPTAWVHVAALRGVAEPVVVLAEMLACVEEMLRPTAVTQIAWMPVDNWPEAWFEQLGFIEVNQIQTYFKPDLAVSDEQPAPGLSLRPARSSDVAELVQIEADTYAPLWRHSADDLAAALQQTCSFDVAELNDHIVGFQISTCDETAAHLARLTIAPTAQKRGVGTALLTHAIRGFQKQNLRSITLNTQADNVASQQLYKKFGFVARNRWFSIWAKQLT